MIGLKRGTVKLVPHNPWKNDLLFRDYLRKHLSRAQQYAELKEELVSKYPDDRKKYTKSKEQFIKQTLEMAGENYNHTPEV